MCFGPFEFNPHTGELRKHGLRIKLQGQPVQVLALLVRRPGEVVTREELQEALWPADTFVDFEHSLNAAIKRLRSALGDSAQSPRFVETMARRGYRFIAPVQVVLGVPASPPSDVGTAKSPARAPRARIFGTVAAAVAFVALAISATRLARLGAAPSGDASPSVRSLAVLPLANLSGDRDQDYFSDAMTDAVRERLEGIGSLRVISRTSSVRYRGSGKSVPDIARELKVDAIVDGSVLLAGQRVRVQVELVQAASDQPLWSDTYDGDLRDVFALQANVASRIAAAIRSKLTSAERARLNRSRRSDPVAFQAYAKGRFLWNRRTPDDLRAAIGLFQSAVAKDPQYALAYDGLADSWLPLGWYGFVPPSEAFPKARAAIEKALELDGSLAEAHTSLAFVKVYYDRDWPGAESEFRRAIELNPNYANAHHWYAEFLSLAGRHEAAIAESQKAREIDPLSTIISTWVSSRYLYARQYDAAVAEGRNAVGMDPDFAPAHLVLGQAYEQKGMRKEAAAEFERAVALGGSASMYRAALAHALGCSGRRSEALAIARDLDETRNREFVPAYDRAVARLGLGDRGSALTLLANAVEERSPRAAFLRIDPRFDVLHAEPKYRALLPVVGPDWPR